MRGFLAACRLLLLVGCGDRAKDLYDTGQFEETQNNGPHAAKLYRQIVPRISRLALRGSGEVSAGRVGETALEIPRTLSRTLSLDGWLATSVSLEAAFRPKIRLLSA